MSGVTAAASGVSLPFYGQPSSAESTAPASAPPSPQDIVDIQSDTGGSFTADAGDAFLLSSLYTASGTSAVGYKVALGDGSGDAGELLLNGQDVTGQSSFTADQFADLEYVAGGQGSSNSIDVLAQSGTLQAGGTIGDEVDSATVQLTANVTGTRSLSAAPALLTSPTGTDADEIAIAQSASIFTGFNGAAAPTLTTVGNFTSDGSDAYSVSDLFTATAPSGGNVVGYKVALGDDSGNNGQLLLNGKNVTGQTSFTAAQFADLQYVSGASGSSESLEVVAQSGKLNTDGTISNEIDSPAVQITNSVTGTRSINAANALLTAPTGTDAASIAIAQSANIFTGFNGAARPTLGTVGSFTANPGDAFSVSGLFTATAPSGGNIVGYKVALGDSSGNNGELLLDGKNVTGQTSFTADQFADLQYVAGSSGSSESLEVVAQSGSLNANGTVSDEIDSPAVQINASVTGTRSINAAPALLTQSTGTDAAAIGIAQSATIFTGFNGAGRPTLNTVGNFTSDGSDAYSVSDLFTATPPSGGTVVGYKVALGDGSGDNGQLLLNGKNVTGQTSFTAAQFADLQYVSGASGSSESLEVVAQSGKLNTDGTISNEIDSPAVQITNSVTGTRSINAANALLTASTGTDAASIAIAQSANIFTGFNGATRPTLTTVGNFTADASDAFSLSSLYTATAAGGGSIVGYRVALGDSSGDNGELLLNGKNVTGQTSFTADEFAGLQYVAGSSGSSQSLEVVAQSGTLGSSGTISDEVDSPAVQINASVTGTRSLNAAPALLTLAKGSDAAAIALAQQASIFTGFNGATGPQLTAIGDVLPATGPLTSTNPVLGAFQSTVPITTVSVNLLQVADGVGASEQAGLTTTTQARAEAAHLLAESSNEIGGSQSSAATSILQLYAYAAYQTSGLPSGSSTNTSA